MLVQPENRELALLGASIPPSSRARRVPGAPPFRGLIAIGWGIRAGRREPPSLQPEIHKPSSKIPALTPPPHPSTMRLFLGLPIPPELANTLTRRPPTRDPPKGRRPCHPHCSATSPPTPSTSTAATQALPAPTTRFSPKKNPDPENQSNKQQQSRSSAVVCPRFATMQNSSFRTNQFIGENTT